MDTDKFLDRQLHPSTEGQLPKETQDELSISHTPMERFVADVDQELKSANSSASTRFAPMPDQFRINPTTDPSIGYNEAWCATELGGRTLGSAAPFDGGLTALTRWASSACVPGPDGSRVGTRGRRTSDSVWRNRSEFFQGRAAIVAFLTRKWNRELDYRLIKEVWTFRENRIAVRFAYEWHDDGGNWFRSYGNENWEFDEQGLMRKRLASINDLPIKESERKYRWPSGPRPEDHRSLSELGL